MLSALFLTLLAGSSPETYRGAVRICDVTQTPQVCITAYSNELYQSFEACSADTERARLWFIEHNRRRELMMLVACARQSRESYMFQRGEFDA